MLTGGDRCKPVQASASRTNAIFISPRCFKTSDNDAEGIRFSRCIVSLKMDGWTQSTLQKVIKKRVFLRLQSFRNVLHAFFQLSTMVYFVFQKVAFLALLKSIYAGMFSCILDIEYDS